eukprot:TRINITY_DN18604_c0_g1_i1.p1 TRINITY_DN18604_c0_g1~~TRINITY_DN18604_c0_g1_i1.p1  ORF type:complete len:191 (-),score=29.76 TRINITY_DN18604_c0_g1_i1:113-685(-)
MQVGDFIVDDPILLAALPRQQPLSLPSHLEGTWVGEGTCEYPPHVPRFQFLQELVIEKAVPNNSKQLNWTFKATSYHKDTREGLHSETGYLRFHPSAIEFGRLELSCSSPSGLCEVHEGTYTQDSYDVWTRYGGLSRPQSSSRPYVTEVRRKCEIRPQNSPMTMEYRVEMATERTPMQQHVFARLRKKGL